MKKLVSSFLLLALLIFPVSAAQELSLELVCRDGYVNGRIIGAGEFITIRIWNYNSVLIYVGQEETAGGEVEFSVPVNDSEEYEVSVVDSEGKEVRNVFSFETKELEETQENQKPEMFEGAEQETIHLEFPVGSYEFSIENNMLGYRVMRMDVPVVYNDKKDRVLLPVRFFAEALGYDVEYHEEIGGIEITNEEHSVNLQIGSKVLVKNNETTLMDTEVVEQNWRTYLPLRYVGEAFDFEVQWDEERETAVLEKFIAGYGDGDDILVLNI